MSQQQSQSSSPSTPMTPQAAARIQSANAKGNGGQSPKGGFVARAQSAGARNGGKGGGKK